MGSVIYFILGSTFLFAFVFFTHWFKNLSHWTKGGVLFIKLLASLVMLYTYTHVYPKRNEADVFKYFDDSKTLSTLVYNAPVQGFRILCGAWNDSDLTTLNKMNYWFRSYDHGIANDNRIIIRVNAFLNLITQGHYELNLCFFLGLSFVGSYFLYLVFLDHSSSRWVCFIAAFLVPSTLFWSSGILKESLLLFALGAFILSLHRLFCKRQGKAIWMFILSLFVLMQVKIYILFALIPVLGVGILSDLFNSRWKGLIGTIVLLGLCFGIQGLCFPSWDIFSTLQGKQYDFIQMAKAVHAGSQVGVIPLDGSMWTLLKSGIIGFLNVLFYPNIGYVKPWYGFIFAVENVAMMALILGALVALFYKKNTLKWPQLWLIFGLIVFVIVGITVPVVGAIIRYKSPVLPFMFFGLYQMQAEQIKQHVEQITWIKWLNTHL